jgi:olefin beta-lactone synthetase
MNIASLFENAAGKFPAKIALIKGAKEISYADLFTSVEETANYFLSKGISKGDRVLVFVPMGIDLYRIVLALFRIGAVAVFLDEWVSRRRMELCCKIARCKGFIGIAKARVYALFSPELRKIPVKLSLKKTLRAGIRTNAASCSENDSALITFTTGSTGAPKAADRTHGFLLGQFNALKDTINPLPDDIDMPVLPIVTLVNLGVGCTSFIPDFKSSKPGKMKAGKIHEGIIKNKVSRITASPFFISVLSEYMMQEKKTAPSVKKIFTGGAPVFPSEARRYQMVFRDSIIEIVYGSTEAEPISHIFAGELIGREKELSHGLPVGKIYFKAAVKIISIRDERIPSCSPDEFAALQLPPGEIGEIIVSGDHVLKKYFENDEAFARNKIIVDGRIWHRTGDSGFLNDTGDLFLTGRCSSLFKAGGTLVAPFIVEGILKNTEGMLLGTVIQRGGKIYLCAEARSGTDANSLSERLKASGIQFDKLVFCKIPRDPRHYSKIDYERLHRLVG